MKTKYHHSRKAKKSAFTKIELLVIVMVVALFTSFVAAGIRGASNQTKIAQCSGNLRQFAMSHLMYANDNFDKLPNAVYFWPWDVVWNYGTFMNQYGTPWQTMYCPGTAPRFQPANNLQLYNFGATTFHVIGYVPAIPSQIGGPTSLIVTNLNFSALPQPMSSGTTNLPAPSAAQRVLIADANLTSNGSYIFVPGGYSTPHICPHLNGTVPAGGNVAMLDGHVEWRPFSQMQVRTRIGYGGPDFLY